MFDIFGYRWLNKIRPDYINRDDSHSILVPIKDIVEYFDPFNLPRETKKLIGKTKWRKFIDIIKKLKIKSEDIGYFGSYLMGLQKEDSDLDIVIRGVKNMKKLRRVLDTFSAEVSSDVKKQIDEAIPRYRQIGYNLSKNDFFEMFVRRWAVINKDGDSLKLHFTYKNSEIPKNPLPKNLNQEIILEGKVVDDIGTCFMPRYFILENNKKRYKVLTYFWQFYHAVKIGDLVRVYGVRDKANPKIIILRNPQLHGLQFIK